MMKSKVEGSMFLGKPGIPALTVRNRKCSPLCLSPVESRNEHKDGPPKPKNSVHSYHCVEVARGQLEV